MICLQSSEHGESRRLLQASFQTMTMHRCCQEKISLELRWGTLQ